MNQGYFNPQDAVQFWEVCELMQTGVSSRAYTPSPYSSAESLFAQFDREYLKAIEH
ncbi:SRPBCC family protein [Aerosakkonema funiforme]|uniref:Aromatic-ring-hydroxylating dioxygenase alpha subunit C-terminal domain-containing protein n=1 Tax=Aerosakkonema funiforme FACHB-1375 TaxID=2949571 RepID=A0A926VHH3_9CYAN|nr:SRPBCC family protein [Aerosakkonema funiforme]MBD2183844.1 hypothetical protein [Aerosakkonema funiforme FACHB-1375]